MLTAQQLINAGFYGYAGWDDASAAADYQATGGQGKGSLTNPAALQTQGPNLQPGMSTSNQTPFNFGSLLGMNNTNDILNFAKQIAQQSQQLAQPAINTLQGVVGDVKSRYQQALGVLRGEQDTNIAKEFGKRGVPTSSGIVSQEQQRQGQNLSAKFLTDELGMTTPLNTSIANLQAGQSVNYPSILSSILGNLSSSSSASSGKGSGSEDIFDGDDPESLFRQSNTNSTFQNTDNSSLDPNLAQAYYNPQSGESFDASSGGWSVGERPQTAAPEGTRWYNPTVGKLGIPYDSSKWKTIPISTQTSSKTFVPALANTANQLRTESTQAQQQATQLAQQAKNSDIFRLWQ